MKILIINQHPRDVLGGSEIQCDLIARHLTRLGHDVIYLAVNGKQSCYETNYTVETGAPGLVNLKKILLKHHPDLVYWRFNRRKFLLSVLTCKLMGVKFVFAISSLTDLDKWPSRINFETYSFAEKINVLYPLLRYSISTRVHYLGYYFVDGVVAQLQQQTRKLPVHREVVIHNSVTDSAIPFSWKKPCVVWVANLKSIKNPETYIELAKKFQKTGVDFLMIGKTRGRYSYLSESPNVIPNFFYLGTKQNKEVNGILQQSLFLVHTSEPIEGFPNVFIQAWMQGKPTISLYCDPDNMIRNNNIGFVSGSFEQLVQDTKALIKNETLREEMGQRAKTFAEAHFDPEKNARKFEAFFQEICES